MPDIQKIKCMHCAAEVPANLPQCPYCGYSFIPVHVPAYKKSAGYSPAPHGYRLLAALCDGLCLLLLAALGFVNTVTLKVQPVLFLLLAVIAGYKPFSEWLFGATPGKYLCKLRVADKNNKKISLATALIRFIPFSPFYLLVMDTLKNAAGQVHGTSVNDLLIALKQVNPAQHIFVIFLYLCALLLLFVDLIPVFFTKKQQALHDILSGTLCLSGPREDKELSVRTQLIFIALCIVLVYYIFLPANEKVVYVPSVKTYSGDCIVKGFGTDMQRPIVRIDTKWFGEGEHVCGGQIVKINKENIEVKFPAKTVTFEPGEKIAGE